MYEPNLSNTIEEHLSKIRNVTISKPKSQDYIYTKVGNLNYKEDFIHPQEKLKKIKKITKFDKNNKKKKVDFLNIEKDEYIIQINMQDDDLTMYKNYMIQRAKETEKAKLREKKNFEKKRKFVDENIRSAEQVCFEPKKPRNGLGTSSRGKKRFYEVNGNFDEVQDINISLDRVIKPKWEEEGFEIYDELDAVIHDDSSVEDQEENKNGPRFDYKGLENQSEEDASEKGEILWNDRGLKTLADNILFSNQ